MASNGDDLSPKAAGGISRRTIVKGAAWTVPAVIIATASPAAASVSGTMAATTASGTRPNPGTGSAGRVVNFTVNFAGTATSTHTVTFTSVTSAGRTWTITSGSPGIIPSGGGPVTFTATSSSNLAAPPPTISVTIAYTVTGHTSSTVPAGITN